MTQSNTTRLAGALARVMERFYAMHPGIAATQIQAFFCIAANPGITQRDLTPLVASPNDGTTSRMVSVLAEFGNKSVDGLRLVRMTTSEDDRRMKNCFLTPRGERLIADILRDLQGALK